eukprot:GEMP01049911.1.p1 GENE.GEMP01049911.1~~GEMP01049911.1.p1  ORF type:complete len:531 (+),score=109.20 GEMP01049911.1:38-1594(+)
MRTLQSISLKQDEVVLFSTTQDTYLRSEVLAARFASGIFVISYFTVVTEMCKKLVRTRIDSVYETPNTVLATQWAKRINEWASDGGRYLVIVDARRGNGATLAWNSKTKPVFDIVPSITYTVVFLQTLDEWKTLSVARNLEVFRGIVVIGGDDVITAILSDLGDNPSRDLGTPICQVPVRWESAGLACAIIGSRGESLFSAVDVSFAIVKGERCPLDLALCDLADSSRVPAFSSIEWGISADVAAESGCCHCLGLRDSIRWKKRTICLRRYKGKLWYLPPHADKDSPMPALDESLSEDWEKMEGGFLQLWAVNASRPNREFIVWPCEQPLQDGLWHILILRDTLTAVAVRRIIAAMRYGTHVTLPGVEFVHCTAFRLVPERCSASVEGNLRVDGQPVPYGPIQSVILPGAGRALGGLAPRTSFSSNASGGNLRTSEYCSVTDVHIAFSEHNSEPTRTHSHVADDVATGSKEVSVSTRDGQAAQLTSRTMEDTRRDKERKVVAHRDNGTLKSMSKFGSA